MKNEGGKKKRKKKKRKKKKREHICTCSYSTQSRWHAFGVWRMEIFEPEVLERVAAGELEEVSWVLLLFISSSSSVLHFLKF